MGYPIPKSHDDIIITYYYDYKGEPSLSHEYISELEQQIQQLQQENHVLKSNKDFGLVWEKTQDEQVKEIQHSLPLLMEQPLRAVITDSNAVNHILINGDNFQALTALYATHNGAVDVIYIDPPYNTGNKDFIYNDSYVNSDDEYKHSKWLSFMEPRLLLARDLLSDDGVIFVSIDDNEQAELKLLMDSIFKPKNFIATVPRIAKGGSGNDSRYLAVPHDYVLVYRKSEKLTGFTKIPIDMSKEVKYRYSDDHVLTRGKYYLRSLQYKGTTAKKSPWSLELPTGETVESDFNGKLGHEWRWGKEKFQWGLENDYIVFQQDKKLNLWNVYVKQYQYADNAGNIRQRANPAPAIMDYKNSMGTSELRRILGPSFSYPKPVSLLKHLVGLYPKKDAVVLDFFAGSGTTGHAVLELNKEDGGTRQFILVTNGGRTDDSAGKSQGQEIHIADEVTYERLRRVITGAEWNDGKSHEPLGGNMHYLKVELLDVRNISEGIRLVSRDIIDYLLQNKQILELDFRANTLKDCTTFSTDASHIAKSWHKVVEQYLTSPLIAHIKE